MSQLRPNTYNSYLYDDVERDFRDAYTVRPVSVPSSGYFSQYDEDYPIHDYSPGYDSYVNDYTSNANYSVYDDTPLTRNSSSYTGFHSYFPLSPPLYNSNNVLVGSTWVNERTTPVFNTYHRPYRTVPPFEDTTTHRDHFRWKRSLPDRRNLHTAVKLQHELPPFEDETTHDATYTGHYLVGRRYDTFDAYTPLPSTPPPFNAQTTHRVSFTPKQVERRYARSRSVVIEGVGQPPMESVTTHQKDYTKKSARRAENKAKSCPAANAMTKIADAKHQNGHFYFRSSRATTIGPKSGSGGRGQTKVEKAKA